MGYAYSEIWWTTKDYKNVINVLVVFLIILLYNIVYNNFSSGSELGDMEKIGLWLQTSFKQLWNERKPRYFMISTAIHIITGFEI